MFEVKTHILMYAFEKIIWFFKIKFPKKNVFHLSQEYLITIRALSYLWRFLMITKFSTITIWAKRRYFHTAKMYTTSQVNRPDHHAFWTLNSQKFIKIITWNFTSCIFNSNLWIFKFSNRSQIICGIYSCFTRGE